jgi:hypothetical protein
MTHRFNRLFHGGLNTRLVPKLGIGQNVSKAQGFQPNDFFYDLGKRCFYSLPTDSEKVGSRHQAVPTFTSAGDDDLTVITTADGQLYTDPHSGAIWHSVKMDLDGRIYKTNTKGETSYYLNFPQYVEPARAAGTFILDFHYDQTGKDPTLSGWSGFANGTPPKLGPGRYRVQFDPGMRNSAPRVLITHDSNFPDGGLPLASVLPEISPGEVLTSPPLVNPAEAARLAIVNQLRWLDMLAVNNDVYRGDTKTSYAMRPAGGEASNYHGGTKESFVLSTDELVQAMNEINVYGSVGLHYQAGQRDSDALIVEKMGKLAQANIPYLWVEYANETWNAGFSVYFEDGTRGCMLGYDDPSVFLPVDATPRNNVYHANVRKSDIALQFDLPAGAYLACGVASIGNPVLQSIGTTKLAGTFPPRLYNGATVYSASDCAFQAGTGVLKVFIGSTPASGTSMNDPALWAVATSGNSPWALAVSGTNFVLATRRHVASRSKFLKAAAVAAMAAASKRAPRLLMNIQMGHVPDKKQATDRLNWDGFASVCDAAFYAPYLGSAGRDSNGVNWDSTKFTGDNPGFSVAAKAALYDLTVGSDTGTAAADAAVLRLKDAFFSGSNGMADSGINALLQAEADVVAWFAANYPSLNKDWIIGCYEQNWQGSYSSGWPDQAPVWLAGGSYTNTKEDLSSYARDATKVYLYRAKIANVGTPLTDTDTWELIPRCTNGNPRLLEFFNQVQLDTRFGEFDTYWNDQFKANFARGYCNKYQSITALPTLLASGVIPNMTRWAMRTESAVVTEPSWLSLIAVKHSWEAAGYES